MAPSQWQNRWRLRFAGLVSAACAALMNVPWAYAAGGGKPATKLVSVADTRDLTGIARWIGDLYNTNFVLFAVMVVVVMSGMGFILGTVFDKLVSLLGIDLGKLSSHE